MRPRSHLSAARGFLKEAAYPATLEKSATACIASRNSLSNLSRLRRRAGSSALTVTSRKKASTGARKAAKRPHRALEILAAHALARRRARCCKNVGEVLFRRQREQRRIVLARERAGAVLSLLGAQDVGGAAIAGQKILSVLAVEQAPERLDPPDDHEQVVLAGQREHRVDEIVPRALLAQVDFETVGEEGEEVVSLRPRKSRLDILWSYFLVRISGSSLRLVWLRRRTQIILTDSSAAKDCLRCLQLRAPLRSSAVIQTEASIKTSISDNLSPFSSTIRITPSAARRSA